MTGLKAPMKLPSWITPGWMTPGHKNSAPRGHSAAQEAPEARLRVANLTRETVLASSLEVANHGSNRMKGLLGRDGLAPGEGLWIKPCEAVHTFGMRFAIDLVYLDRKKRIRKVRSGVPPWRMSACLTAHSVIELPSGTILATQTRRGDRLEFSPSAVASSACVKSNS
jgi:uncharacterized membrane protein (UPF0127 family)